MNNEETHKQFAKKGFNTTWKYLDKENLTDDEALTMLSLAYMSAYHWNEVGTPRNKAVSDWQISRAYAKLLEGKLSLKHAERCLKITLDNKVEDNYLSAYEGIARAYAVNKDYPNATKYIKLAEEELKKVTDKEDLEVYEPQIKETKAMIK
jgi:hypothetical protein